MQVALEPRSAHNTVRTTLTVRSMTTCGQLCCAVEGKCMEMEHSDIESMFVYEHSVNFPEQ